MSREAGAELSLPDVTALLDTENAVEERVYRVGAGDEIVVVIWGRPDLGSQVPVGVNGQLRSSYVGENGGIFLPFLGNVRVGGQTIEEIRRAVQAEYSEIIENPQVEIQLRSCDSQYVYVGGAVASPGNQALCANRLTVGQILTAAQGLSEDADVAHGVLTRGSQSFHVDYLAVEKGLSRAKDVPLADGDVLYFPPADERFVYVFGEVNRQGLVQIPVQGMTLLEALASARGLDLTTADHSAIFLIRPQGDELVTYRLSFTEVLESAEVQLAHGDRIFVAVSGLTRWDQFWRKAIPFTTVRTTLDVNNLVQPQQ